MSHEIRQQVTDRIHKVLAEGLVPWGRPWLGHRNDGPPTNAMTSLPFRGVNVLLLHLAALLLELGLEAGLQVARLLQRVVALGLGGLALLLRALLQLGDLLVAPLLDGQDALVGGALVLRNLALHALIDAGQRLRARLFVYMRHDIEGEVENALQVARREVQQQADAAGRALEIPDVADRRRQLDVAHALPPDL